MSSYAQLTITGEQVPHPTPMLRALTAAQRVILRHIGHHGTIRPVEAGKIVHAHRDRPCPGHLLGHASSRGCCQYASSDGWDALNRMHKRGIVEPIGDGRWRVMA